MLADQCPCTIVVNGELSCLKDLRVVSAGFELHNPAAMLPIFYHQDYDAQVKYSYIFTVTCNVYGKNLARRFLQGWEAVMCEPH